MTVSGRRRRAAVARLPSCPLHSSHLLPLMPVSCWNAARVQPMTVWGRLRRATRLRHDCHADTVAACGQRRVRRDRWAGGHMGQARQGGRRGRRQEGGRELKQQTMRAGRRAARRRGRRCTSPHPSPPRSALSAPSAPPLHPALTTCALSTMSAYSASTSSTPRSMRSTSMPSACRPLHVVMKRGGGAHGTWELR